MKPAHQLTEPSTLTTTLSNGLRVISQETYGQAATIGMYVQAGSAWEEKAGSTHMMQHLFFKSTANRSHAQLVLDLENIGASVTSTSGREQLVFSMDLLRDALDEGMELLADTLLQPVVEESEVEAVKAICGIERESLQEAPQMWITEAIHGAAYGTDSPMGHSLHATPEQLPQLTVETVKAYRDEFFVGPRMVLAGTGVEHERFVALAEKWFKEVPASRAGASPATPVQPLYTGGEVRIEQSPSDLSYCAIAFECDGWHGKGKSIIFMIFCVFVLKFLLDLVPICVWQTLLGGGDSFSAGGPGKGMYSRLYTTILNRYFWVESATAFTSMHNNTGLLGIYGAAVPEHTHNLFAVLCNHFVQMFQHPVHETELQRAKNQLKSSVLMNLESRLVLNEDIGRQLLTYGKREDPNVICDRIDAITALDLQRVAQKILKTQPSIVSLGEMGQFPSYELIQKALKNGLV